MPTTDMFDLKELLLKARDAHTEYRRQLEWRRMCVTKRRSFLLHADTSWLALRAASRPPEVEIRSILLTSINTSCVLSCVLLF